MDREFWTNWITQSGFLAPLIRFAEQFEAIYYLLHTAALIMGVAIIIWAIVSFLSRKRSGQDDGSGTRIVWGLVGGSFLTQLSGLMSAVSETMWGTSDLPSAMQYSELAASSTSDPIKAALYLALGILIIIGWVIGIRSCYILSQVGAKTGHGDGTGEFWKAATSLIFASILINMQRFADGMAKSFSDTTFSTTFGL